MRSREVSEPGEASCTMVLPPSSITLCCPRLACTPLLNEMRGAKTSSSKRDAQRYHRIGSGNIGCSVFIVSSNTSVMNQFDQSSHRNCYNLTASNHSGEGGRQLPRPAYKTYVLPHMQVPYHRHHGDSHGSFSSIRPHLQGQSFVGPVGRSRG
jgi:hypothetical protein